MNRILLISIKPIYANLILDGSKTVELRKSLPRIEKETLIVIYASAPMKAIVGVGIVSDVIKDDPKIVWAKYKHSVGINKQTFNDYFKNKSKAVGILLKSIYRLDPEIKLDSIRKELPNFSPPQSYKYLSKLGTFKKYIKIENSSKY